MRVTFLGTRGNIPIRSAAHQKHSAMLVHGGRGRVLVDCGRDWQGRLGRLRPVAILVSHAHDDHAAGLRQGAPCAVYATAEAWSTMGAWPLPVRYVVPPRHELRIAGLVVEAWPVEHSLIAPAVGYRIAAHERRLFYVPDVARLPDGNAALRDVDVYIGDGATLERSLVRRRDGVHVGHASIRTQLEWCADAGLRRAVFTHCGSGIVRSDARDVARAVRALGREYGVSSRTARDGLVLVV